MICRLFREYCLSVFFYSLILQTMLLTPPAFGCCNLTVTSPMNGDVISTEFVTIKGSVASSPYPQNEEWERAFTTSLELRTYAGGNDWGGEVLGWDGWWTFSVEETNRILQAGELTFKPPGPGGYRLILSSYSMACVRDDACTLEDSWKEIFFYYQYDPCVDYLHSLDNSCAASDGFIEIHEVPGAGPVNTKCVDQQPVCMPKQKVENNNNQGPSDTCR